MDLQGLCRAPFRPADSNPGRAFLSAGGVGRNIAENLTRLGCRVDLVSALGDDVLSRWLRDACVGAGIGTDLCLTIPESSASQYVCILDSDGALVGAVAAMDGMDALVPEALEARAADLAAADLIVADANLPAPSLEWIAERYSGKPLLLDTVSAAKAEKARACAGRYPIVKPNRAEAEVLTGISCGDREGALAAASALRNAGSERVFLSMASGVCSSTVPRAGVWCARRPPGRRTCPGRGTPLLPPWPGPYLRGFDSARSCGPGRGRRGLDDRGEGDRQPPHEPRNPGTACRRSGI